MIAFETILEGLVAILLLATIVYAALLNRKLNTLRQGKSEFEALVKDLNLAIEKAEQGTAAFGKASDDNARRLDGTVKEARALREDLGRLIDRGVALADSLSTAVRTPPPGSPSVVEPRARQPRETEEGGWEDGEELPPATQEKLRKLIDSLR